MDLRDLTKKVAVGGSVALASAGALRCSSDDGAGGAVDAAMLDAGDAVTVDVPGDDVAAEDAPGATDVDAAGEDVAAEDTAGEDAADAGEVDALEDVPDAADVADGEDAADAPDVMDVEDACVDLTTCNDNGAVDPPPPPLDCQTVDEGEQLVATGTVDGKVLTVVLQNNAWQGHWDPASLSVADLQNASDPNVEAESDGYGNVIVTMELDGADTASAGFTFQGTLVSSFGGFGGDDQCAVKRTFHVAITTGGVQVTDRAIDRLPLRARHAATIATLRRDGMDLILEARTPFRGPRRLEWTVSGGAIVARKGSRVRWRLPRAEGLYQAELVVDYGDDGFAFDVVTFEVS